jgi:hypothetical protein
MSLSSTNSATVASANTSVNNGHVNWYLCPLEIIWLDLYSIGASVILRKIMNYQTCIRWEVFNEVLELGSKVIISEYLNSINYYVTVMHEFCDGCQCQYKSRNCFGNLAESVEEFGYSKIIRNFFLICTRYFLNISVSENLLLQACDRLVFRLFSANSKSSRVDLISALPP